LGEQSRGLGKKRKTKKMPVGPEEPAWGRKKKGGEEESTEPLKPALSIWVKNTITNLGKGKGRTNDRKTDKDYFSGLGGG